MGYTGWKLSRNNAPLRKDSSHITEDRMQQGRATARKAWILICGNTDSLGGSKKKPQTKRRTKKPPPPPPQQQRKTKQKSKKPQTNKKKQSEKEDFLSVLWWKHFQVQKGPETNLWAKLTFPLKFQVGTWERMKCLNTCTAPGLNQFSSSQESKFRKEIWWKQAQNSGQWFLVPQSYPSFPNIPARPDVYSTPLNVSLN